MPNNLIHGNDGRNTLSGTGGADLIYGFDPNGPQGQVTSIAATRVATGLNGPLFAGPRRGDADHLFIVEQTGAIKILDLNTGQVLPYPFLDLSSQISTGGEEGVLGLAFDPNYATNGFFYVDMVNTVATPKSAAITLSRTIRSAPTRTARRRSSRSISPPVRRTTKAAGWASVPTATSMSRWATAAAAAIRWATDRTPTFCSARCCGSTCTPTIFPPTRTAITPFPPTIPFVGVAGRRRDLRARPAQSVPRFLRSRHRRFLHRRCRAGPRRGDRPGRQRRQLRLESFRGSRPCIRAAIR